MVKVHQDHALNQSPRFSKLEPICLRNWKMRGTFVNYVVDRVVYMKLFNHIDFSNSILTLRTGLEATMEADVVATNCLCTPSMFSGRWF